MRHFILLISLLAAVSLIAFAAAADGAWNLQGGAAGAPGQIVMAVSGETLTGTAGGAPIVGGKASGTNIWFSATRSGVTYRYKGTVSGNNLTLREQPPAGQGRTLTYLRNN
jgi:hypothetical protein